MTRSGGVPSADRPRVLFVINAAITGGAERHTAGLAADLLPLGFTTQVFAIKAGTEASGDAYELIEPRARQSTWERVRKLAALIASQPPDLIVAVNQRPLAVAMLARRLARARVPVAVIFHTTTLRNRKEQVMQWGYDRLFNRADALIFISERQRAFWEARGLRNRCTATILNGISLDRFAPPSARARQTAREDVAAGETDLVIGCSAMLRSEKNHVQMVEAIAALRHRGSAALGVLVGEGQMRPAIEARARALNIEAHIRLLGLQADIRPVASAFDVGILCSTAVETLSLAALELMAMGIPMVMSDIGGASEIVDGENGRLVPVGQVEPLVAAMEHFREEPLRRDAGLAARRTVERRFGRDGMNKAYADLFSIIISQGARG